MISSGHGGCLRLLRPLLPAVRSSSLSAPNLAIPVRSRIAANSSTGLGVDFAPLALFSARFSARAPCLCRANPLPSSRRFGHADGDHRTGVFCAPQGTLRSAWVQLGPNSMVRAESNEHLLEENSAAHRS